MRDNFLAKCIFYYSYMYI